MRNRDHNTTRILRRDGRRNALQRLDELLERNTKSSNTKSSNHEIIALMRKAAFADVDAFQKSGKLILPKL